MRIAHGSVCVCVCVYLRMRALGLIEICVYASVDEWENDLSRSEME